MTKIRNLKGQKFGRLEILEFIAIRNHKAIWLCRCDCGNMIELKGIALTQGWSRSCGCLMHEETSKVGKIVGSKNLAKYVNTVRQPLGESAKKHLYYLYGYRAKKRNLEFSLTLDEFSILTKAPCYYCGAEPSQVKKYKKANGSYIYNGVDRFNNAKGYTKDNCVSCCKRCNTAKMEMTSDEFADWIWKVYRNFVATRPLFISLEELGIPR